MKKILYAFGMILIVHTSLSQQDALFTQYMDNQIYVNPAYTGSKGALSISALHRQQWVGFDGAPITTSLALHTPTSYSNLSLGLDALNDKIGPVNRFTVNGNVAYSIKFSKKDRLNVGVKIGVDSYTGDLEQIDMSGSDPLGQRFSYITPTAGFGVNYFSEKFFIGATVPRILGNINPANNEAWNAKHGYVIAGLVIDLNRDWKLRPSTQIRIAQSSPLNADLTVMGIYADKFWIGPSFRLYESLSGIVQYEFDNQFRIGYAADFPVYDLRGYSFGSHEILLTYNFRKKVRGIVSPRYF